MVPEVFHVHPPCKIDQPAGYFFGLPGGHLGAFVESSESVPIRSVGARSWALIKDCLT